ncbi:transposase [Ilumatobacter sp.]|uniref:transposase n=1 Tax=Ilumatobacter sp. TaxID=1967498 RepID=UPI003C3BF544
MINHGVDGQDLFAIESDWLVFESILDAVCAKRNVAVAAYALMSNHFHLLADVSSSERPNELSHAMAELQSGYARHFNSRTNRTGPLFRPRFLSYPVSGETAFARTARYIHANPIDITGRRAVAAYRWSSLPVYLGRRSPAEWMRTEPLASMIDASTYLATVTDWCDDETKPLHGVQSALPPRSPLSVSALETALDELDGESFDRATCHRHRRMIMMLCLDLRAADVVALARRFDCTENFVRREAHRARTERIDDPTFERLATAVARRAARSAARNLDE